MRTEQERIDRLAQKIRDFRIAVSGGGGLEGGFGKLPDQGVTLAHLEKSFEKFLLTGQNGIQAWGSLRNGYVLFGAPVEAGSTGFPAPITPPPGCGCVVNSIRLQLTTSGTDKCGNAFNTSEDITWTAGVDFSSDCSSFDIFVSHTFESRPPDPDNYSANITISHAPAIIIGANVTCTSGANDFADSTTWSCVPAGTYNFGPTTDDTLTFSATVTVT